MDDRPQIIKPEEFPQQVNESQNSTSSVLSAPDGTSLQDSNIPSQSFTNTPVEPLNDSPTSASYVNLFIIIFYASIVLIIASAYFGRHKFNSASWAHDIYYLFVGIGLLNVIYYGWIKRSLVFGRSSTIVKGGAAVAASIVYIAVILIAGGVAWNYNAPNAHHSITTSNH